MNEAMQTTKADIAISVASVLALILLWESCVRILDIPYVILPAPSALIAEGLSRHSLYFHHSWITLYETVLGFVLAAVIGVALSVAIVYSRTLKSALFPLIVTLQIVPKVAIAPLLLIWVGYGVSSKIVLALLVAFFPIVVNMVAGLAAVDEEILELCRILHANRWKEFIKVRLPNALPYLFSSLKVASTLAVIGAVIGEFVGGDSGLGYLIIISNTEMRTSMAFVSIVCLSVMGLALYGLIAATELLFMPWERRRSSEGPATAATA
jgi:NitT/TauT family transport system permease protein